MEKGDIYRQVAQLHVDNLDQGFLATLGVKFLALMYRAIDEVPECVLLVEERDGRVVGFVSGGIGTGSIYRKMLRHPIGLTLSLLPSLLRPARVVRIVEILRYGGAGDSDAELPAAELLSLAVAPTYRGQKIADRLYASLVDHFKASGVSAFKILVGESLAPAHRFYGRVGAVPVGRSQVHKGQSSTIYVHRIA